MSPRRTISVVFVVALFGAGLARADPMPLSAGQRATRAAGRSAEAQPAVAPEASAAACPLHNLLREYGGATPAAGSAFHVASDETIRSLPAVPGSASLFLYAVGTLGALQVGRSARRLQLGEVSAWLHSESRQVGVAVPCDPLRLHAAPLPAMLAARPILTCRSGSMPAEELPVRPGDALVRTGQGPRGPPVVGRFI